MSDDRIFDIPAIDQSVDPKIRNPYTRMREALQTLLGLRGDGSYAAITARTAASLIVNGTPGPIGPVGPTGPAGGAVVPDLTPPPSVTGLSAVAGFVQVIVTWDAAVYTQGHGHGQTNIYAVKSQIGDPLPTFMDAQRVYDATGALTIASIPSELNTRWHIWAKWQTADGVESTSPAGGTNGVTVTTGQDITQLLDVLAGSITESQLYATLGARINLIDGAGAGSVNARIATESSARTAGDSANASLVTTLQAKIEGAESNLLKNSSFEVDANADGLADNWLAYAAGTTGTVTRSIATGPTRHGTKCQAVASTGLGTTSVDRVGVYQVVAFATDAGSEPLTLSAWVAGNAGSKARVYIDFYNSVGAFVGSQSSVPATLASATAMQRISTTGTMPAGTRAAWCYIWQEQNTSLSGAYFYIDAAQVARSEILTGYAQGDQPELSAAVQTEAIARANADGTLFAQYTVKLDVNGYVSGYGLASTSTGAAPTSSFIIRADSFAIASPAGPGVTPRVPFVVRTTPTIENGVLIPVGVYMDAAYIVNLSAMYARFGTLVADSIAAGQINAANLTLGSGAIGGNLRSTNFTPGSVGWILRPNGTAEFDAAVIRGQLVASQIDTRGLSIRDAAGNVIFAAGNALDFQTRFGGSTTGLPANNANVGAQGGYVNSDPLLQAPTQWTFGAPGSGSATAAYYQNFNGGNGLTSAWDKADGRSQEIYSERFPISAFKTYIVESSLYMWGANTATHYLLVAFYSADGTLLDGSTYPTGWPSAGTYHYYGLLGTSQAVGGSRYSIKFGALETAKIPPNAAYAKVGILGNYNNTTDRWSWGGAQVREVVDGQTLSITPANVSTYIANAAIKTAQIDDLAVTNAKIGNLQVTTLKIGDDAVTTPKVGDGQITDQKIVSLNADKINVGSLRGRNLQGAALLTKGTYLTAVPGAGAGTVSVDNTADFASSGSAVIIDSVNDRDVFTYSGKTANSFTGCSGVLGSHTASATVIPLLKTMVIDDETNEMRFYGNRGDGTIEELASVGISVVGADNVIGNFGSSNGSAVALRGVSNTGIAVLAQSTSNTAVFGASGSGNAVYGDAASGRGVYGVNVSASLAAVEGVNLSSFSGVRGSSAGGYGGDFTGNATKSALFLTPVSTAPSNKAVGGIAVILTPFGYRICYADGSNWLRADNNAVWNDVGSTGGGD